MFGIYYSKPERDRWNNKAIPGYSSSGKKCIMILQLWIFMLALCCFSRSKYAWACKIKREVLPR